MPRHNTSEGPRLGAHQISRNWRQTRLLGEEDDELEDKAAALVSATQSNAQGMAEAYIGLYQPLLWSEEIQLEADLALFNLEGGRTTIFQTEGRSVSMSTFAAFIFL